MSKKNTIYNVYIPVATYYVHYSIRAPPAPKRHGRPPVFPLPLGIDDSTSESCRFDDISSRPSASKFSIFIEGDDIHNTVSVVTD
jgi:hypothetical protein